MPIKEQTRVSGRASGIARSSGFAEWQNYSKSFFSSFNQVSISHPGPPYKAGGNWLMYRSFDERSAVGCSSNFIQGTYCLGDPTFALGGSSHTPKDMTDSEVKEVGAEFFNYANSQTRKPIFDGAVAFGELYRDGVPHFPGARLWREKALTARSAGSEYLNYEFGWKPFTSDLKDFARVVLHGHKLWNAYVAKANAWRKISRSLPSTYDVRQGSGSIIGYPTQVNVFSIGTAVETSLTETWCEGEFRYYLPMGEDTYTQMRQYAQKARYLLGARLDPDVVWNLAPWSWAADWFGNMGDIMENMSALGPDGLVGRNTYMMHHYKRELRVAGTPAANGRGVPRIHLVRRTGFEGKTRRTATPFGFSIGWEDLTPRQIAITVALGGAFSGSAASLSK